MTEDTVALITNRLQIFLFEILIILRQYQLHYLKKHIMRDIIPFVSLNEDLYQYFITSTTSKRSIFVKSTPNYSIWFNDSIL